MHLAMKFIISVGALLLGIFLLAVTAHNLFRGRDYSGWTFLTKAEEVVPAPKKFALYSIIYNRYDVFRNEVVMLSMLTVDLV